MTNFYEIDFLSVEAKKSGDAIALRYELDSIKYIHVIDAGFQATGPKVAKHIREHYENPTRIDHVIATHPDGDHAGGLRTILEEFDVGTLWMLRPWAFAEELLPRFATYNSLERLTSKLKALYPNLAALEEIAHRRGIAISDPFQGARIGAFTVLAPTRARYLDLVVDSERTPESIEEAADVGILAKVIDFGVEVVEKVAALVRAAWGEEVFSPNQTSAENDMSIVQSAVLCGESIVLTADAGRAALAEAAIYAPMAGLQLPGVDKFQVPHHGSRRNVNTEVLDTWLGVRLGEKPVAGGETFSAYISSAKEDSHHPRKAVVRAFIHRGAKVFATEGVSIRTQRGAPSRAGWGAVTALDYPESQEEQ